MKFIFIQIMIVMIFASCKKSDSEGPPPCIEDMIDAIKATPVRYPPSEVWQYQYNSKTVYFIPSPCCDQYDPLYDNNCSVICAPSGGIVGGGDGRCPDFFTARTNEKLIWKDPR